MLIIEGEKHYTTREVSNITGLATSTIKNILDRGWFDYDHNFIDINTITVEKREVTAIKKDRKYLFPQESLDNLIEGVKPNLKGWPSLKVLAERFNISACQLIADYHDGKFRARKSIKKRELFVPLWETRVFFLDTKYNLEACRDSLGLINHQTLWRWQRMASKQFIFPTRGRRRYISPPLLGRLRTFMQYGNMSRERLSHLYDSNEDFMRYIGCNYTDTIYYFQDKTPNIKDCRVGMKFFYEVTSERGIIREVVKDDFRPSIVVEYPERVEKAFQKESYIVENDKPVKPTS